MLNRLFKVISVYRSNKLIDYATLKVTNLRFFVHNPVGLQTYKSQYQLIYLGRGHPAVFKVSRVEQATEAQRGSRGIALLFL